MGFTVNLSLSTAANTLNGRSGIAALSTVDTSINGNSNNTSYRLGLSGRSDIENLTAFITGVSYAQTVFNGGVVFVTNQNGVFSLTDNNTYPYKIVDGTAVGNSLINFSLSATGQECASGVQVGTLEVTLSSTALSATSAGTVKLVDVNIINSQANTTVWCVNTPVAQFTCQQDLSRLVQGFLG